METNEQMKSVLRAAICEELERFFETIQEFAEGELAHLEAQVVKTSQALGRTLLEGMLSSRLRARRPAARRMGSGGHRQRLVGERPKDLLTLVGKVRFVRPYSQCLDVSKQEKRCPHGEAPDDARWGVEAQRTTGGLQQQISYLCGHLTFAEAAETFCRWVPLGMSARQALTLMRPVGTALAAQEDQEVEALWGEAAQPRTKDRARARQGRDIARLYIDLDGVLVRLRRDRVPLEPDEQARAGDVYREIKVGAVFRAERGRERSEVAPGAWVDTPVPGSLRYVARRTARGGFDRLLYALAVQGGLERAQQVIVLGDGAPWIWHLVGEQVPQAVQIVDMSHAKQHVWEVAAAVFGRATPQAAAWATSACALLVDGQTEALLAALHALPPLPPDPGHAHSVTERAVDYFTTHAERMCSPLFRAQGIHLGSGIAEAACKTVVSTRAKRSGMRWTPEGVDALLPLRTAVLNKTYDAFWEQAYAA